MEVDVARVAGDLGLSTCRSHQDHLHRPLPEIHCFLFDEGLNLERVVVENHQQIYSLVPVIKDYDQLMGEKYSCKTI